MQMTGFSLLLIPFIAMAGFEVSSLKAEIPYRLLNVVKTPDSGATTRLSYFISVQDFLERSAVEGLICEVIEKEKPAQVPEIGIAIYQGLETISTSALIFDREPYEHDVAIYLWSSNKGRLSILRDLQGVRLAPIKIYAFDHVQSCRNR